MEIKAQRFAQNLEKNFKKLQGTKFIVVKSLYSMDGYIAPLADLVALCQKHSVYIIIDEAHSTVIHGQYGEGLIPSLSL
ncbi:MAG: aminotransferase class I/II-fold pyridoxal phosphate-dependent enzyme [Flavobacteriales bacterium]